MKRFLKGRVMIPPLRFTNVSAASRPMPNDLATELLLLAVRTSLGTSSFPPRTACSHCCTRPDEGKERGSRCWRWRAWPACRSRTAEVIELRTARPAPRIHCQPFGYLVLQACIGADAVAVTVHLAGRPESSETWEPAASTAARGGAVVDPCGQFGNVARSPLPRE